MNYQSFFLKNIEKIKSENRYRDFEIIEKTTKNFPIVTDVKNRKITLWCSNDYLGISCHQEVIKANINATKLKGVGSGGTRNISGTTSEIHKLENQIAKFHNKERGIVFTSGYIANLATISSIVSIIPDIIIFSDKKNHASIIEGIKHSRAKCHIFEHNDLQDLENLVSSYSTSVPKLIIFEGVYSMDASSANVVNIIKIAKKYNALTYIDEVHTVGLYGKNGGGIAQHYDVEGEIDIVQGTFAKSVGSIGGYIASSFNLCDAIRLNGSSFIFTTSLPSGICAGISKALDIIASDEGKSLRDNHFKIVNFIKSSLISNNINFINNEPLNTHIMPIMICDAQKAQIISKNLFTDFNIYVQHINYPTVPSGLERLRITVSSLHTLDMAKYLVSSLKSVLKSSAL